MSRVIEILDSDDDSPAQEEVQDDNLQETSPEIYINDLVEDAKPDDPATENQPAISQTTNTVIEEATATNDTVSSFAAPIQNSPSKTRSRNRRKSVLQTMRASPDMQFETISLDDEDDEVQPAINVIPGQQTQFASKNKPYKTQPKILAPKPPTSEELVQSACDEFLATNDVNSTMRQIAEERVRINFLLTSYGMPDINFSLYTQYERLKFQFEDRLKQRKIRNWNMNGSQDRIKIRRTQQENS